MFEQYPICTFLIIIVHERQELQKAFGSHKLKTKAEDLNFNKTYQLHTH